MKIMGLEQPVSLEYLQTDESPSFKPWATDGSRGGDVLRGKANWYRKQWGEG